MEFIEKDDMCESIYLVFLDKVELENLLNDIVRNTSYKIDGTFTVPSGVVFKDNEFVSNDYVSLPNRDPMYINIKNIYRYTLRDSVYGYHGDSVAVEGTEITSPKLASIIKEMINDYPDSIRDFLAYSDSDEMTLIDDRIARANKEVDEIDNTETKKKICALNNLKELCDLKKEKKYFNTELLKAYYSKAMSLVVLQLVGTKYEGNPKFPLNMIKDSWKKKIKLNLI